MTAWKSEELEKIGAAEELQIASLRKDGSLRSMRIIWVVRVGNDLYVRSVNGRISDWFRGVQTCHEGQIRAGRVMKDVTFLEVSVANINEKIDAAYAEKYHHYASIIPSINSSTARAASIKLVLRTKGT
jgi:hypothetical protein